MTVAWRRLDWTLETAAGGRPFPRRSSGTIDDVPDGKLSITLVTPSLNQGPFIGATIESVLSQQYPDLEYVVRDGGSTDNTLEVLASYASRLACISEADGGQSDAINRGLRQAKGEVLSYLNSDDLLLPGALAEVADAFRRDPDVVLVFGRAEYIDAQGRHLSPCLTRADAFARLAQGCFIAQPAVFFRRRVWEEVGPFDEHLRHAMDYDYWLRVAERFGADRIQYLDRPLAASRMHPDAKSVKELTVAFDEIFALVRRRTGFLSLWWCVAKWDHLTDGRNQIAQPHSVRLRALAAAMSEFLRRNPPRLWWRGAGEIVRSLTNRVAPRSAA